MSEMTSNNETRPSGLVFRIAEWWAVFGGIVLLGVVGYIHGLVGPSPFGG